MKLALILAIMPLAALADSNVAGNYSHVGFGYQNTHYEATSIAPYTDNQYSNKESKNLGGLYLAINANLYKNLYLDGYADFGTRFSTSIDKWQLGLGFSPFITPSLSIPLSCGAVNYRTESDYAPNHSDEGIYCSTGIKAQIATHWALGLIYQHDFLDVPRNELSINNTFQFGSVFGITAGIDFAKRKERETGVSLGFQFSFK
ncbi:hypothetical protein [Vibrio rotiferianus]|uniref:hypothetical protein n=1 Tax=Vibrio rotiferianus TaxID=190895 RepID=UPI00289404E4|nr:conserved exported hypothetical protein [Vibrio rotiferianus]CAH1561310.1 conserved exported hypothetical protein [Vibrio rotiferianus]